MTSFDPNAIGIPNGNFLGLPYSNEEADIIIIPVPWDVTTSYHPGTCQGPEAIIKASTQVDLFDFFLEQAWKNRIATLPLSEDILQLNEQLRPLAQQVIHLLETGMNANNPQILPLLEKINLGCEKMNQWVYKTSYYWISKGKTACVLGGDHSTSLGLMRALTKQYDGFGILHIDAHADLRKAYEGFIFSHASSMYNALELKSLEKLVQVGIRDVCEDEMMLGYHDKRIKQYDGYLLAFETLNGKPFSEICEEIVKHLPSKVYVSFDIDGLNPELCPHTGTPVPGGLSFDQVVLLLHILATSGRQIIGFDLVEVAPGSDDEWDANVGARILQKLCNLTRLSIP
ncbi:MAG TPA: agmatinase family protein [Bacteroidales bacterium]|jgi:agmatinase|nr:agmatinase family protein [Bacteroidales bacterium]MDI9573935.1 agmatinase family protein [Bacteroidota bacterium]OQC60916.1 MAG: N(1)-aminopropylagmatine ureohydrolase [Bacteroidetes bacterium ADurb.Bin012]MBP9512056.1 agmatinase family protein [Bacteroidales bacterium]MBP9588533.1 agmatinase family protein [Bacteroidales bacterium]